MRGVGDAFNGTNDCRNSPATGGALARRSLQEVLHGCAHVVEALFCEDDSPVLFDFGDSIAGVVERLPAAGGGKDQLGAPIGRMSVDVEDCPDAAR